MPTSAEFTYSVRPYLTADGIAVWIWHAWHRATGEEIGSGANLESQQDAEAEAKAIIVQTCHPQIG